MSDSVLINRVVSRLDTLISRLNRGDTPLQALGSHFRYEHRVISLNAGLNNDIIKDAPERWGFIVSCPIGTRALVTRVATNPVDPAGVFLIPNGVQNDSYGWMTDDTLDPIIANLNTVGYLAAQAFNVRAYFSGYVIHVSEIFYKAKVV